MDPGERGGTRPARCESVAHIALEPVGSCVDVARGAGEAAYQRKLFDQDVVTVLGVEQRNRCLKRAGTMNGAEVELCRLFGGQRERTGRSGHHRRGGRRVLRPLPVIGCTFAMTDTRVECLAASERTFPAQKGCREVVGFLRAGACLAGALIFCGAAIKP